MGLNFWGEKNPPIIAKPRPIRGSKRTAPALLAYQGRLLPTRISLRPKFSLNGPELRPHVAYKPLARARNPFVEKPAKPFRIKQPPYLGDTTPLREAVRRPWAVLAHGRPRPTFGAPLRRRRDDRMVAPGPTRTPPKLKSPFDRFRPPPPNEVDSTPPINSSMALGPR